MTMKGVEVKKMQEFKNLASTVQSNGNCGKETAKVRHLGDKGGQVEMVWPHKEDG